MKMIWILMLLFFTNVNCSSQSWLKSRCINNSGIKISCITAYVSKIDCSQIDNEEIVDSTKSFKIRELYNKEGRIFRSFDSDSIESKYFYEEEGKTRKVEYVNGVVFKEWVFNEIDENLTEVMITENESLLKYYHQKNSSGQQVSNYRISEDGDTTSIRYISYNEDNLPNSISFYSQGEKEYTTLLIYNDQCDLVRKLNVDAEGEILKNENFQSTSSYEELNESNSRNRFFKTKDIYGNLRRSIFASKESANCVIWSYDIKYDE